MTEQPGVYHKAGPAALVSARPWRPLPPAVVVVTADQLAVGHADARCGYCGHDLQILLPNALDAVLPIDLIAQEQPEILTALEGTLWRALRARRGEWLTRDVLIRAVWGAGYEGSYHLLRVNMARMRTKAPDPRIECRFGYGYRMLPKAQPGAIRRESEGASRDILGEA